MSWSLSQARRAATIAHLNRARPVARPPLAVVERPVDDTRTLVGRLEEPEPGVVRAFVAVRRWKRHDFETPGWVPRPIREQAAALARELVEAHGAVAREWTYGAAWCAEGRRPAKSPR